MSERRARAERVYLKLVRSYQSAILNYIWRLVGDADVAEDLTQESFVKAWRALDRLELEEDAEARRRAWLYRIAHNTATDHLRRKARVRWLSLDAVRNLGQGNPAGDVEVREPLAKTLDSLSEDHRRVLLLFNHLGLSAEEVAEVLGISEAAARKRRQRARAAFESAYRQIAGDDDGRETHVGEGEDKERGEAGVVGEERELDRSEGIGTLEAKRLKR